MATPYPVLALPSHLEGRARQPLPPSMQACPLAVNGQDGTISKEPGLVVVAVLKVNETVLERRGAGKKGLCRSRLQKCT